jgi:hypothetical protein
LLAEQGYQIQFLDHLLPMLEVVAAPQTEQVLVALEVLVGAVRVVGVVLVELAVLSVELEALILVGAVEEVVVAPLAVQAGQA